jgi:hypothetical protein
LPGIAIPGSVTKIGNDAFSGCSGLTSIVVSEGYRRQPDHHARLQLVWLHGQPVKNGCNKVFDSRDNCNAIIETKRNILIAGCKNTVVPDTVTEIGWDAFLGCTGLKTITIPDSVTRIGNSAFYGCTGLPGIVIPGSVTKIGNDAFRGCSGLTSIVIPDSVTEIGSSAFRGCTGLTRVVIGNSVTEIGSSAFEGCTGLTSIVIGNSVTEIGKKAFYLCEGLTGIVIPESVTEIGNSAFYRCTGLTSIVIPESVRIIGCGAFYECSNLNVVIAQRKEYLYIQKKNLNDSHASFDGCKNVRRQCRRSQIKDTKYLLPSSSFLDEEVDDIEAAPVPPKRFSEWVFQALSIPFTILLTPLFLLIGFISLVLDKLKWYEAIEMLLGELIIVNYVIAFIFKKIVKFMVKPFNKKKK